jgi:hypothetical protein
LRSFFNDLGEDRHAPAAQSAVVVRGLLAPLDEVAFAATAAGPRPGVVAGEGIEVGAL